MITTTYHLNQLQAADHAPVRIAVVSDLHDRDPREALEILSREQPDLILIPGDLMERHEFGETTSDGTPSEMTEEDMIRLEGKRQTAYLRKLIKILDGSYEFPKQRKQAADKTKQKSLSIFRKKTPEQRRGNLRYNRRNGYYFLQKASRIAPIVYSSGNHEWYHTAKDMAVFRKYHIHFLDNASICLHIKDITLMIGGLPTRYDEEWLSDFSQMECGPDTRKILLMHHPEYYDRYVAEQDTFDLIVSGHAHGGQLRLFGHGLYAPSQGFLPKYHHGIYPSHGSFIVSAGVSNTNNLPRLGNPTEVVILTL